MNHKLWTLVGARVLALSFVLAGATACGERLSDVSSHTPAPTPASPSAVVIGTVPGQATGDPPGTTPVAGEQSDVSKATESARMPLPGQPNDHSNLAPNPSQKADSAEPKKSATQ